MTVIPAYGRDYKSAKAAREDWKADRDFTICDMSSKDDGRKINRSDAHSAGTEKQIMIRYKRLTMICKAIG